GQPRRRRATAAAALSVEVGARGRHPQFRAQFRHRGSRRWWRGRRPRLQAGGAGSPAEEVRSSPRLILKQLAPALSDAVAGVAACLASVGHVDLKFAQCRFESDWGTEPDTATWRRRLRLGRTEMPLRE